MFLYFKRFKNRILKEKKILKLFPYFIAFFTGSLFLYFSFLFTSEMIRSLLVSISASFFTIPFLYLIYEKSKKTIHKQLNKEIFEYAKYLIDNEIFSILNMISKIMFSYGKANLLPVIESLPYMERKEIEEILGNREFFGFQIFKHWEESESYFSKLLENSFVISKLEDEQVIVIIKMINAMRNFQKFCLNINNFFEIENKNEYIKKEFAILDPKYAHPNNLRYPERLILIKKIDKDKGIVIDFGDFKKYTKPYLLKRYKIKNEKLNEFSEVVYNLLNLINRWLSLTGNKLLIDERKFRIRQLRNFNITQGVTEEEIEK